MKKQREEDKRGFGERPGQGRAGRQRGERETCGLHTSAQRAASMEGPASCHSQPASQCAGLLPRETRWWQRLEGSRQAEQMVRGQCDFGGHSLVMLEAEVGSCPGKGWTLGHLIHPRFVTDLTTHSSVSRDRERPCLDLSFHPGHAHILSWGSVSPPGQNSFSQGDGVMVKKTSDLMICGSPKSHST